jgi:peptide/nickel transport system ATP-binding protein
VSLLEVDRLHVDVHGVPAVHDVSFTLDAGSRTGLIGESGCGKSLTALALMGLLPEGVTARGRVLLEGRDLLALPDRAMCRIRGDRMGMVFQEPMTALNPLMMIGEQVAEPLRLHRGMKRRPALARAVELCARVQLPDPERIVRRFPHELSGGQRQRVVLAAALACEPAVIVADEPTTALDVTVQAEMLRLMDELVRAQGAALLLITHDLPVVASVCEEILVMYGGRIVETGPVHGVFADPRHPYTAGLRAAVALEDSADTGRLTTISGTVPPLGGFPDGCVFRNRCPRADEVCRVMPPLEGAGRQVACHHPVGVEEALAR